MAETGCLKDGHFQNLQVEGNTTLDLSVIESTGTGGLVGIAPTAFATVGSGAAATKLIIGKNAAGANPYVQGTTQLFPLGTELIYGDRKFRYVQMDGTVSAGRLVQQAAAVGNHINMTIINEDTDSSTFSHAIGSTTIKCTAGATAVTDNQYDEGYLLVNDENGKGQLLKIKSHTAVGSGGTPIFTTYDPLCTAIVKHLTKVSVHPNPYKDVVVAPKNETGAVMGATVRDMTDDNYGWIVTSGPSAILAASTLVLGQRVVRTDAVHEGAVMADNGDDLTQVIGTVMAGGVTNEKYCMIMLNIA